MSEQTSRHMTETTVLFLHLPNKQLQIARVAVWVWVSDLLACPGSRASCRTDQSHGRPHTGANWAIWPPEKMDEKLKSENMQKGSFLCLCYILRAIRAGRCRERRYADHIFIHIYLRMHHFVVEFSKFSSPLAARGHWPPNQNPADVPDQGDIWRRTACEPLVQSHSTSLFLVTADLVTDQWWALVARK